MTAAWLLWVDGLIALIVLIGVIRISRAQRRHARETHAQVAALARLVQSRGARITLVPASMTSRSDALSLGEVRALIRLKQRADFDPLERIVSDHEPRKESE